MAAGRVWAWDLGEMRSAGQMMDGQEDDYMNGYIYGI